MGRYMYKVKYDKAREAMSKVGSTSLLFLAGCNPSMADRGNQSN